jgi:hypothetical protein
MPPALSPVQHYEIEGPLAAGGMAVLYRARDTRLGRAVALKRLPPDLTRDPERRRRLLQEARAAAAVSHPALAQIYEVGEDEEGVFIAMELVPGKTVRELVAHRELDLPGAIEIGLQVAAGLQKAHACGIIHRDIKPANIMVTPDGPAKILDFGLARVATPCEEPSDVSHGDTLAQTRPGLVMGTVGYMSPEQARGLMVDPRSDIFAFGVLLYEMVTGQRAFGGATALDQLHAVAYDDVRPLTQLRADVPPALSRVVSRCLGKHVEDRYPDCRALIADLQQAKREADSGISGRATLVERVEDRLRTLGRRSLSERMAWMAGTVVALVAVVFVLDTVSHHTGLFILLLTLGIVAWRRARNHARRLARRFATKAQKLPEVRIVTLQGTTLTVAADRPTARTYVRLHALLDGLNMSTYFGDRLVLVVRDDVSDEGARALLAGSGVLYVRDDGGAEPARAHREQSVGAQAGGDRG